MKKWKSEDRPLFALFQGSHQTIDVCGAIVERRCHTNAGAPLQTRSDNGEQAVADTEIINDSLIVL